MNNEEIRKRIKEVDAEKLTEEQAAHFNAYDSFIRPPLGPYTETWEKIFDAEKDDKNGESDD